MISTLRPSRRVVLAGLLGLAIAALGAVAVADPAGGKRDAAPKGAGYAPDPVAPPSAKQWVFDVTYAKGKASIARARSATLARPAATARVMGRFAIELYIGKELLDRIRFDVPLTGDAPETRRRRLFHHPTFDEGVTARLRVQMADNPRASYAKLVDRQTGAEQRFSWPPEPDGRLLPLGAPGASAPAVDGGPGGDAAPAAAAQGDAGAGDAGRR